MFGDEACARLAELARVRRASERQVVEDLILGAEWVTFRDGGGMTFTPSTGERYRGSKEPVVGELPSVEDVAREVGVDPSEASVMRIPKGATRAKRRSSAETVDVPIGDEPARVKVPKGRVAGSIDPDKIAAAQDWLKKPGWKK